MYSELVDKYINPKHYKKDENSIECIDIIIQQLGEEAALGFCQGNAFKYIFRCRHKGNEIIDMRKAIWYLEKAIEIKEKIIEDE